jgi:hypothetical protein
MLRVGWRLWLAVSLMAAAAVIYLLNYLIFQDAGFMLKLLLAQLGFLPISVFFVTLVINQLLVRREKAVRLNKLNMVIGAFFSEVGVDLLRLFAASDVNAPGLARELCGRCCWQPQEVERLRRLVAAHLPDIDLTRADLPGLRRLLADKRDFLLRLLEHPFVLEHESFSRILWAVFHLGEELAHRQDVGNLSENDRQHLAGDIERGYLLLTSQWLAYLEYLDRHYPYLFSLAVRLNPFDPQASAAIQ